MNISHIARTVGRTCFYLLFVIVPIILTPWNYELFEYNKIMVLYAGTSIIAASWLLYTLSQKKLEFYNTPFALPLLLFLASQLISALFSLDPHMSWFGYYSRFNGGVWSILSYIVLFFAFIHLSLSDTSRSSVRPLLYKTMLGTAFLVAVYGVLERFGIDKHLWIQDVQTRVFSTLGQPNWLASYLLALFFLAISFGLIPLIRFIQARSIKPSTKMPAELFVQTSFWVLTAGLFFLVLLLTRSRSGLLALGIGDALFWLLLLTTIRRKFVTIGAIGIHVLLIIIMFFNGSNITFIDRATLPGIRHAFQQSTTPASGSATPTEVVRGPLLEYGGTESGTIRKYVWQAAITAWSSTAKTIMIGTGTETFAFAFYQFKPVGHNLTSEWDFLYNKAHNEYLNFLATTGIFGFGTYMLFIGLVIGWFLKHFFRTIRQEETQERAIFALALFAGWVTMLVINFFGFSVVMTQLFFFLFPAMIWLELHTTATHSKTIKLPAWFTREQPTTIGYILILTILAVYLVSLFRFWLADTWYASAYRLNRNGAYSRALEYINKALDVNPGEPVYRDEASVILAGSAVEAIQQKEASAAATLAKQALAENDRVLRTSPANMNFWKSRTKILYSFVEYDESLLAGATDALKRALMLAPNDPKIMYNIAVLEGRAGNVQSAIEYLKLAVEKKPNYRDAYWALAIFYDELKNPAAAKATLETYLKVVDPNDKEFLERTK